MRGAEESVMFDYDTYKKGFDAWETATAELLDKCLKSPLFLGPIGAILTQAMKAKGAHDKLMSAWWTALGLPTKRDQERALFALHKLESHLIDLEEKVGGLSQGGK
jgi:hypothetical protein